MTVKRLAVVDMPTPRSESLLYQRHQAAEGSRQHAIETATGRIEQMTMIVGRQSAQRGSCTIRLCHRLDERHPRLRRPDCLQTTCVVSQYPYPAESSSTQMLLCHLLRHRHSCNSQYNYLPSSQLR